LFAHSALPSVAFQNPSEFLFALSQANPGRQAMLRDLWEQVRAQCPWDAAGARAPTTFPIHSYLLWGNCGILIELPEPQRPAEAYFATIVVDLPGADEPKTATPRPAWYFTL